MFGQNRQQLRQVYYEAWQKYKTNQPLTALEKVISNIIQLHPEYHSVIEDRTQLDQEYFVEQGETNPFLHMALHISLHEQISTNRPQGINTIYQSLVSKFGDAHTAEHQMMECLTESLWLAQRNNQPPSETDYLNALKALTQ
jgi:hypothetical protein